MRSEDSFAQLKAGNFPNSFENRWRTKDGGKRLISWTNAARSKKPQNCSLNISDCAHNIAT
ncbi:MAG: hypothetical protein ACYC56_07890 [Candidatus Aquicultor sp.]